MVFYRRSFVPGGTYFFTVALTDRNRDWLVKHVDLLRAAFRHARREQPFAIEAVVVLPEHLHCIWTLPPGDADYSQRWRLLKSRFSRALSAGGVPVRKNAKGEYNVWQRRFWEHTVRDERDFQAHVDYIHYNPVKHGLVTRVGDWPYSSFHRFVRLDWLHSNWASDPNLPAAQTGE
ncbi:MAG TPA: transposase [Phototrophicaceae bacterium]|jgi:putative transposase|nr:transposase [Phototrophicaceae bacterium]